MQVGNPKANPICYNPIDKRVTLVPLTTVKDQVIRR